MSDGTISDDVADGRAATHGEAVAAGIYRRHGIECEIRMGGPQQNPAQLLLAGRVAEELVFGAVTTGAANDLHRVAEISRAMIHDYAMGTSITSRKISAHGGEVSDRTRELRDEEQQHLADEARRAAARLLSEHREQLDELAGALLRNEVLERGDIDAIMVGTPRFRRGAGGLRVVAADPGQPPATTSKCVTVGSWSSR